MPQGRHAEAEPLVVSGYEGMKQRESRVTAPDRSRLSEAAVRVVRRVLTMLWCAVCATLHW